MLIETTSAFTAVREALSLIKTLKEGYDSATIETVTGQLTEKITELRLLNLSLAEKYQAERQITMQLTEKEAKRALFSKKLEQYEAARTTGGSLVYRSKKSSETEIIQHDLCAHCCGNEKISILQPTGKSENMRIDIFHIYKCPECKNEFLMGSAKAKGMAYADMQ